MTNMIWTYWHHGWHNAPGLCSLCLKSWRHHNPGWRIEALDAESIRDHIRLDAVDMDRVDITMQKRSLFVRLELLRRYGGVWADATLYCWQPLDSWLPQHLSKGYFAFRDPGPDRLASNWFLASAPECPLLVKHSDAFVALFRDHFFANQQNASTQDLIKQLHKYFSQDARGTLFWTSDFAIEHLRAYPYFIFHYLFNRLVLTDPEFNALWAATRSLSAEPSHFLQAMAGSPASKALARIEAEPAPIHKLDWRLDTAHGYWKDVLAALAARLNAAPDAWPQYPKAYTTSDFLKKK